MCNQQVCQTLRVIAVQDYEPRLLLTAPTTKALHRHGIPRLHHISARIVVKNLYQHQLTSIIARNSATIAPTTHVHRPPEETMAVELHLTSRKRDACLFLMPVEQYRRRHRRGQRRHANEAASLLKTTEEKAGR